MDELDGRLIALFAAEPRIAVLEASRRLGVARGTVQARLDKLATTGVVTGWGPELSPEALGYPVTAFLTLELRQDSGGRWRGGDPPREGGVPTRGEGDRTREGGDPPREGGDRARVGGAHDAVGEHLATIPEVLEAHTITGAGDMWARVVARSNTDLQRVIDLVLEDPAIVRSSTVIALATQVPFRVLPLVRGETG